MKQVTEAEGGRLELGEERKVKVMHWGGGGGFGCPPQGPVH